MLRRTFSTVGAGWLAAAAALAAPGLSLAQSLLEEVLVTAQRREESIQDIALSVSSFGEEQLRRLGAVETLDMARLVPGFIGHNNTGLGGANTYSIRALNNTESIATFDPPVGSYIDDVFIQRQAANNFSLFDAERVEVLRGPQGTLFGRNTTGGAVRVIMKKPAEEMGGYLELGYGRFDRFTARGSVDIPITPDFLTKISAYYINDDGFVDNVTTGEDGLNFEENVGVRGALQWRISDSVTWDASVMYINQDHANMLNFSGEAEDPRFTSTGLVEDGAPLQGLAVGDKQGFGLGNETWNTLVVSDLTWETAIGTVNIISAYNMLDHEFLLDFFEGTSATGGFVIGNDSSHDQYTQEVKLVGNTLDGRLDYVAGFYYFYEDNKTDFVDVFTINPAPGVFAPLVLADRILNNETEAFAGYLQLDYRLTDEITLIGGIRYTDETKEIDWEPNPNPAALGSFTNADVEAAGIPRELNEKIWTPKLGVEYAFNDDLMVYASATRGFKSGAWNARVSAAALTQPVSAEEVWTYELGTRSEWFDQRLRANVTAFLTNVDGFQLPSAFENPNNGQLEFIFLNTADLRNVGIEFELTASPIDRLNLFANLAFQNAYYTGVNANTLVQARGCRTAGTGCGQGTVTPEGSIADPVRAPEVTIAAGGNYSHPLGGAFNLIPSFTIIHYSEQNVGTSELGPPLQPQFLGPPSIPKFGGAVNPDGYTTVNAGITLENTAQNWEVTLECKNCTDRDRVVSNLPPFLYLDDPMTWRLVGRYSF